MRRRLGEPAPRLSAIRADVPPAMDELVDKALAKDPAQRHQTAEELREALLRVPV